MHVRVPRLRLLAPSLARSFPPSPQLRPSRLPPPQSLMNIERPLLYFPSSIAEAEARHIVRRRRRLILASRSGRGQRSPGLGQEPVSRAGGMATRARAAGCGWGIPDGLRPERRLGWGCVCVSVAARGREAMAPPPPAARSAARGPPGRAHCSRPESTGLARRPESFRGSAPHHPRLAAAGASRAAPEQ